jgi:hypothetical protein
MIELTIGHRDIIGSPETFDLIDKMSGNKDLSRHLKSCKRWASKHGHDPLRRKSGFTLFSVAMSSGDQLTDEGKKELVSGFYG